MLVFFARRVHLFPSRTEQLSVSAAMILGANSSRESSSTPTLSLQKKSRLLKDGFFVMIVPMNRRTKVISASALTVLGIAVLSGQLFLGDAQLQAATVGQTSIDIAKYFLWAGVGLIVVSALMFIGASSD